MINQVQAVLIKVACLEARVQHKSGKQLKFPIETHERMETSKPLTFSYVLINTGKYRSSNVIDITLITYIDILFFFLSPKINLVPLSLNLYQYQKHYIYIFWLLLLKKNLKIYYDMYYSQNNVSKS